MTAVPSISAKPTRPASTAPVLSVQDLRVSFHSADGARFPAVQGISFDVPRASTVALVGESGSGKSVTALSVLRLLPRPPARYDSGRILLKPDSSGPIDMLTADEPTLRRMRGGSAAMIFQEPMTSLNPVLTVGDQIQEAIRLHQRVPRREAVAIAVHAMEEVGIRDAARRMRAYPHEFSGGMRQRVMIAMALACKPSLLIADEPTTALDVTVQARILDLLADLKTRLSMAVLLITHDLGLVADYADHVCVMYAGRIVESGAVAQVLEHPVHPYTRALLGCRPSLHRKVPRLATITQTLQDPRVCELTGPGGPVRLWWPGHAVENDPASTREPVMLELASQSVLAWDDRPSAGSSSAGSPRLAPFA